MLDRLSLKTVLLAGACLAIPLSYATGENSVTYPVIGAVLPGSGDPFASVVAPAVTPVSLPASAAITPSTMATTPSVVPVMPTQAEPATAVMPAQAMPSASPQRPPVVVREVAPGENPFVSLPATGTTKPPVPAPAASIAPAAKPASTSGASLLPAGLQTQPPATAADKKPSVDETALRYYAQTRDLKRLGAELRRLKALYPEWEAPENLFDTPTNISEQPLWDIYGQGDYVRVRMEITRMQSENPNWKPSQDLMDKLALGEVRKLMERAYGQRNWGQVVTLAENSPQLLVCPEMNSMWMTAESLGKVRDYSRSFDLYKYILSSCDNADERLATAQKASLVLPEAGFNSLIALGRIMPDGTSEFENISYDVLRQKMGQAAQKGNLGAGISQDELQRFSDYVQRVFAADDAALFGWFYYSQQNWEASYQWFVVASRMSNSPKTIEGVILSLRNLEQRDQALQLARKYAPQTPELKKIYIELVSAGLTDKDAPLQIAKDELDFMEKLVFEQESALGAQALGWHYLDEKKTKEASRLFKQSVEWEPTEGGVVGLAVLAARAKNWSTVSSIKAKYGEEFTALNEVKVYSRPKVPTKKVKPKAERPNLLTLLFKKEDADKKKDRLSAE